MDPKKRRSVGVTLDFETLGTQVLYNLLFINGIKVGFVIDVSQ